MDISPGIIRLINEIGENRTDGASELARRAANVLKEAAESSKAVRSSDFILEMAEVRQKLISSHPAMAPVYNIVNRVLSVTEGKGKILMPDALRRLVADRADEVVTDSLQAVERIASKAAMLFVNGDVILTHSYSSTVMAVLKYAAASRDLEVIVTRSGPGRTGERTARELGDCQVRITFIDDTACGVYIGKATKVLVGADRICADGCLINGIGTYPLALAALKAGVPLYVACETLKFDSRTLSGDVNLEEKSPEEVADPSGLPSGTIIKNPYFDITPLDMVTAVITENGVFTSGTLAELWGRTVKRKT